MRSTDHSTVKVCSRKQVGVEMGSPRPSFGRAKDYSTQGHFEYGHLEGPRLGPNNLNSYRVGGYRVPIFSVYTYNGVHTIDLR